MHWHHGILGLFAFILIPWVLSEHRKGIQIKPVLIGLFTQIVLATIIMKVPFVRVPFELLGNGISALKSATTAGTSFVYGYLGGGAAPFEVKGSPSLFIFAFQALPMILVVGALSMLLFHWRILPIVVRGFSWVLQRSLNIGGALGVAAAAKVFLGMTEAPLLIRPYLRDFSRSELFTIMTCGMATTSGTVMALYSTILEGTIQNPIAHLLTASIISVPAAITISRIMIPQMTESTSGQLVMPYRFSNWMDPIFRGATDGVQMIVNITAMLIVVIALVSLTNKILAVLPFVGGSALTLERMFGFFLAPITWLMGVPWSEAHIAAHLLGTKTVINEVIAFLELAKLPKGALSPNSSLIMTYALCGFANFSSIGIMVGGLGSLVPERRDEVINLGVKCLIAGTLSTCLSGTIIGLIHSF